MHRCNSSKAMGQSCQDICSSITNIDIMKYRYFIMLYIISGASEINIKINFIRVINGEINYLLSNTIQKIHNKQTKKRQLYYFWKQWIHIKWIAWKAVFFFRLSHTLNNLCLTTVCVLFTLTFGYRKICAHFNNIKILVQDRQLWKY